MVSAYRISQKHPMQAAFPVRQGRKIPADIRFGFLDSAEFQLLRIFLNSGWGIAG
jgi:hypothetical protein